jgi:predicted glycosyltransferase involved in capsule biosynthesis
MHRYIYTMFVGHIPEGFCVMHTCDNRMCINPTHLKAGTLAQNNLDMTIKGRNRGRVLTPQEVAKIRKRGDYSKREAENLGITSSHLYKIRSKQVWKNG